MKVDITKDDLGIILEALAQAEASAKRAAKAVKSEDVRACYIKQEYNIRGLSTRLISLPSEAK